jgi:hypothetical protein
MLKKYCEIKPHLKYDTQFNNNLLGAMVDLIFVFYDNGEKLY